MDLDELQRRWQEQERTLQTSLRLNKRLLRAIETQKVSTALGRASWGIRLELALDALLLLWLGSYLADRIGVVRFALPAAALFAGAVARVGSLVAQLVRIRSIDYGAPIVAIQKRLEALRLLRLATTRWTLLLAPMVWTPLVIVALDRFLGIDAWAVLTRWIIANFVFGLVATPLLWWIARLSIWRRLSWHLDGRNLIAARQLLSSLAEFEGESEPSP